MKKILVTLLVVGLMAGCQEKEAVNQEETEQDIDTLIETIYTEELAADEYNGVGTQLSNGAIVTYGTLDDFLAGFKAELANGKTAKAEAYYKIATEHLTMFKNDTTVKELTEKYKSL